MGTFTVKAKSLNTQAEYVSESLKINVSYNEDAINDTLQSMNGSIFHAEDNTFAGNFNGSLNGEEIEYSMSQVKSKDMANVIAAISDIESQIKTQEHENNGEE